MKTDKQQEIDVLAAQAEDLLKEGHAEADALLIKTAAIRTQLTQFKQEISEQLAQRDQSTHFHQ